MSGIPSSKSHSKAQVSVLLSVYNGEETLDKCLQSILDQTNKQFKIVCLNDHSTDNTQKVLKKWQAIFGKERFTLLYNETNLGVPKSSNRGIAGIDTPYTARIDADDYWDKQKLEKQLAFLEQHPEYGIVGCNHINLYTGNSRKNYIKLPETNSTIRDRLFRRNPFAHSCVIIRTSLLKKVSGYNERMKYGSDYDIYLRILPYTKLYNIQECLCTRVMLNQGISIGKQRAQMWQSIKTRSKYIRRYKYSWKNYIYLLEPLVVILTPNFIKNIKRKHF